MDSDSKEFRPSHNSGDNVFPNEEFSIFKKQRTLSHFCHLLVQSYEEKRSSAFYLIWDNLDLVSAETIANNVERTTEEAKVYWLRDFFQRLKEKANQHALEEEAKKAAVKTKKVGRFGNSRRRRMRRLQKGAGRKKIKFGKKKEVVVENEDERQSPSMDAKYQVDFGIVQKAKKTTQRNIKPGQMGLHENQAMRNLRITNEVRDPESGMRVNQGQDIGMNDRIRNIEHQIYVESEYTSPGESNLSSRRDNREINPRGDRRGKSGNQKDLEKFNAIDEVRESQEFFAENQGVIVESGEAGPRTRDIYIKENVLGDREGQIKGRGQGGVEEPQDNEEMVEGEYTAGGSDTYGFKSIPTFGAQNVVTQRFAKANPSDNSKDSPNRPNANTADYKFSHMQTFGTGNTQTPPKNLKMPQLNPMNTFGIGKKTLPKNRLNLSKHSEEEVQLYSHNNSISIENRSQHNFDEQQVNMSNSKSNASPMGSNSKPQLPSKKMKRKSLMRKLRQALEREEEEQHQKKVFSFRNKPGEPTRDKKRLKEKGRVFSFYNKKEGGQHAINYNRKNQQNQQNQNDNDQIEFKGSFSHQMIQEVQAQLPNENLEDYARRINGSTPPEMNTKGNVFFKKAGEFLKNKTEERMTKQQEEHVPPPGSQSFKKNRRGFPQRKTGKLFGKKRNRFQKQTMKRRPDPVSSRPVQKKNKYNNNNNNPYIGKGQDLEENKSNADRKAEQHVARVFYLLSRRFNDTKYKTFFMDQIELLVYKHRIKDPKILNIIGNLDMRFDMNDLCPQESEEESGGFIPSAKIQSKMERRVRKGLTRENMANLEQVLLLFRGDQLFAPLLRLSKKRLVSHRRNFFVSIRNYAKLAPFRRLHRTVEERVKKNKRDSFFKMLFYLKPNLRLLLLIFIISKVKQRHVMDAYRKIAGVYWAKWHARSIEDVELEKLKRGKKRRLGNGEDDDFDLDREGRNKKLGGLRGKGATDLMRNFIDQMNQRGEPIFDNLENQEEGSDDLEGQTPRFMSKSQNLEGVDPLGLELMEKIEKRNMNMKQVGTQDKGKKDDYFEYYDSSLNASGKRERGMSDGLEEIKSNFHKKKMSGSKGFKEDGHNGTKLFRYYL